MQHGMEFRPYYLAREWRADGHQVKIVASSFSHLRQQQPQVAQDFQEEIIEGIQYQWVQTPIYSGNGIGRVINIFAFVFKLMFFGRKVTQDFAPDVVVASSTYPLDVIPAFLIAKKFNAKLVHEVHDLWPLTLIELGGVSKFNPLVMLFQWAENFSYRNVNRVVSMLQNADRYMFEHGLSPDRFVYVPNGVVKGDWDSPEELKSEIEAKIKELRNNGYFVFGYAGAHGPANAMSYLIEAAGKVKDQKIAFVLVGQGDEKLKLQSRCKQLGLTNVFFFDSISKKQIPTFLSFVDAVYIGWSKKPIYRFGINPNKLLDYMMAARPIVHSVTAGNDWVQEAGAGFSIPAENVDAISDSLLMMSQTSQQERDEMGSRGKKFVQDNHLYSDLSHRFLKGIL